ncbi:hypothetical protein LDL59_13290 [Kaistella anthropi]|nr:hypothetical protein [Kaistella anthropi]
MASGGLDNQTSFTLGRYPSFESKTYAGYIQGKYDILSVLQLSAGLRHQDMNLEVQDFIGTMEQVQMAYGVGKTATSIPGGKNSYGVSLLTREFCTSPTLINNIGLLFPKEPPLQILQNFMEWVSIT